MRRLFTFLFALLFTIGSTLINPSLSVNAYASEQPAPVFSDSFENALNTAGNLTSSHFGETLPASRGISYVEGVSGTALHLDSLDSYVGYSSSVLNPAEGTISFYWKPDADMYTTYTTRQTEWTNYGSIAPPFSGYLLDTVGFNAAYTGSFAASLVFNTETNKSTLQYGTWSGSNWSHASYNEPENSPWDSSRWYEISVSWSQARGKIRIFVDGAKVAENSYNTSMSSIENFFIGENPWNSYWPYGPHSMKGSYDELRVYSFDMLSADPLPAPSTIELYGNDYIVSNPSGAPVNASYSATVKDQNGNNMQNQSVTWSVNTTLPGISISQEGLMTVAGTSVNGVVRVKAESAADSSVIRFRDVPVYTTLGDDHESSSENATSIPAASTTSEAIGEFTYPSDEDWFSFTPAVTGFYGIGTTSDLDTHGVLYDSDGETFLKENDFSDYYKYGDNFHMGYPLEAGKTYFIKVSCYTYPASSGPFKEGLGSYGLVISPEERIAKRLYVTKDEGNYYQHVPVGNTVKTMDFDAEVYDSYGNDMGDGDVEFSIGIGGEERYTSITGASINADTGELTVTSELPATTAGAYEIWVYGKIGQIESYYHLEFWRGIPTSMNINGNSSVRIPYGSNITKKTYTATVIDQNGWAMDPGQLEWSIASNEPVTGASINADTGELTLTSEAVAGNITLRAGIPGNQLVSANFNVELLPALEDDFGNDMSEAHEILYNNTVAGKVNYSGDVDYFSFTPELSGKYRLNIAADDGYTYFSRSIYNSQNQYVYSDYNGEYELNAGNTYYIAVSSYSLTGYSLKVGRAIPSYIYTYGPGTVRIPSAATPASISYSASVRDASENYMYGEQLEWSLADNNGMPASVEGVNINPASGELTVTMNAQKGASFRVKAAAVSNPVVSGYVTVTLVEDDYGNNWGEAEELTDITAVKNGRIDYYGDNDIFRFVPQQTGYYEFSFSPGVHFHMNAGHNTESIEGKYYCSLEAGNTYYIDVSSYQNSNTEYSFSGQFDGRQADHIVFESRDYAFIPSGSSINVMNLKAKVMDSENNWLPGRQVVYSATTTAGINLYYGGLLEVSGEALPGSITVSAISAEDSGIFAEKTFRLRPASEIAALDIVASAEARIPATHGTPSSISLNAVLTDTNGQAVEDDVEWSLVQQEGSYTPGVYIYEGKLNIDTYAFPGEVTVKAVSRSNPSVWSTRTITLTKEVLPDNVMFEISNTTFIDPYATKIIYRQNGNYKNLYNTSNIMNIHPGPYNKYLVTIKPLDWSNGKDKYIFFIPTSKGILKKEITQSDLGKYFKLDFDDSYVPLSINSSVGMTSDSSSLFLSVNSGNYTYEAATLHGLNRFENPYLIPAGTYEIQLGLVEGNKFYDVLRNDFVVEKIETTTCSSITVDLENMVRIEGVLDSGTNLNFSHMFAFIPGFSGSTISSAYGTNEFYVEKGYYDRINLNYTDSSGNKLSYNHYTGEITTNTAIQLDTNFGFVSKQNQSSYNPGQNIYFDSLFELKDGYGNSLELSNSNYNAYYSAQLSYVNLDNAAISGTIAIGKWDAFTLPQAPGQYSLTVQLQNTGYNVTSASAIVVITGSVTPPPPPVYRYVDVAAPSVVMIPEVSTPAAIQLDLEPIVPDSPVPAAEWSVEQITSGSGITVEANGLAAVDQTAEDQVIKVTAQDAETSKKLGEAYILVTKTDPADVNADVTGDSEVKVNDLVIFTSTYGKASGDEGFDSRVDFNNDNKINMVDFFLMKESIK